MEQVINQYKISTDKSLLSLETVQGFLSRSYWAGDRPREVLEKSIMNSICFGVYDGTKQVGFARAVTDYATVFWIADVFIDEMYRGQGIGKALVCSILETEELQGLGGVLMTRDAHRLYEQFGFIHVPNRAMARRPVTG